MKDKPHIKLFVLSKEAHENVGKNGAKMSKKIAIFKGREIRRTIHNDEWWFSVSDVVEVISESVDVKQYIKKIRTRDAELNSYWGTICTPLTMTAKDGKRRKINCANTEGISRIIQSIPFSKASYI